MDYPTPWRLLGSLILAVILRRRRSFREDALSCVKTLRPPIQLYGEQNIPPHGPCVVTVNHYARSGFPTWWLGLAIGAVLPYEMHWVVTSAWTYPDRLRQKVVTPITRWVFKRVAEVYGFTNMPPMPPRPEEAVDRALAVRRILTYVRQADEPVIGLAPEGRDIAGGVLGFPPEGAGRFILHLAELGLPILPVGIYEHENQLCVRFGESYCLQIPQDLPKGGRDAYVSRVVMQHIAPLLPCEMRGEFG